MTLKTQSKNIKQTKEIMYLRYGSEKPSISSPPFPLLTLAFVARLTKLPVSRVQYLDSLYFKGDKPEERQSIFVPKYRSKPKGRAVVTETNITPEEFDYLICEENLQAWAHLPLLARCIMFHRKFPDRWIRRQTLGSIMRKAGLRKKSITIRNVP